jgi:hypothetical protein
VRLEIEDEIQRTQLMEYEQVTAPRALLMSSTRYINI